MTGRPLRVPRGLVAPVVLLVILGACTRGPAPAPLAVEGLAPWEVPESAYGTQRLFRAHYDGPEATGGFHLTLRLVDPDRFQVQAVHSLGKKLWSLDLRGNRALFLDHRGKVFCTLGERSDLSGSPLGSMPLRSFPAVLLGRLPEAPAGPPRRSGDELRYPGGEDRRWRVTVDAEGRVDGWVLSEGGRPAVWWSRRDGEALLSDRVRGVQLSWRQVVSEPLAGVPEPLEVPAAYRPVDCSELDLSVDDSI